MLLYNLLRQQGPGSSAGPKLQKKPAGHCWMLMKLVHRPCWSIWWPYWQVSMEGRLGGNGPGLMGSTGKGSIIGVTGPPGLYGSKREQTDIVKVNLKRKKVAKLLWNFFFFIIWPQSAYLNEIVVTVVILYYLLIQIQISLSTLKWYTLY